MTLRTAAFAAVIALAVGVALIAASGGGPSRAKAALAPAPHAFARTPAGAVQAATAWCQDTAEAFINGTWDSTAGAMTTPAFRAQAERLQPASTMVHNRITGLHTPYALRLWPLGYAVARYSPTTARVRVWQLFELAIAGPLAQTMYTTTTVSLRWMDGGWKITAAPSGPNLPPPGSNATASQVASWVNAVGQLGSYAYAP